MASGSRSARALVALVAAALALPASSACAAPAPRAAAPAPSPAAVSPDSLTIHDRLVDFGYAPHPAPRAIDTVVIHSSYDALGPAPYDLDGLLAEYRRYGVAPHYVIDRAGTVWRTVRDRDVAWHAGRSRMPDGRTGVNAFSLGIEMMTTKRDSLTAAQYAGLNALLARLCRLYPIRHVVSHALIAPGRKDDPWNFDFDLLNLPKSYLK
ncbi:MAG: N-acetylmuramoyl-L-alanine amidase [Candidatus Krumholzibacteriia bacterium]